MQAAPPTDEHHHQHHHHHSPTMNRMVDAHVALMLFSWGLALPVAVGIAVLGKKHNWSWWVKAHMAIMALGFALPMTAAAVLGITAANGIQLATHKILGFVMALLAWMQVGLGITNHIIYRRRSKRDQVPHQRPWHNNVHIWLGRCLFVMGFVTILSGMLFRKVPLSWFITFSVYIFCFILSAVWLYFRSPSCYAAYPQKQQDNISKLEQVD